MTHPSILLALAALTGATANQDWPMWGRDEARNNASPVTGRPRSRAITEQRTSIMTTRISPGTTPARNSPPTETEDPAMNA